MFEKKKFINEKTEKIINGFGRYLSLSNLSEATIRSYMTAIKTMSYKGDIFAVWNKISIEDEISLSPNLKPSSKKAYILALRQLYNYLINCGVRRDNPANLVKIPRIHNGKPRYLKEQEIQKIFTSVKSTRNSLIIHLLYYCGLRAKELLVLSKRDINFEDRIVTVVNGKGDKYREVPFPETLIDLIKNYYKKYAITEHLFFSSQDRSKPLSYEALKCTFKHLGKRLGIHITAHRFRHSFATYLFNKGCDSDTIQAFMGHSDFSVTKKYLYVMASTRRQKYDNAALGSFINTKQSQKFKA